MKISYRITGPHTGGTFKVNLLDSGRTVVICNNKKTAEGVVLILNTIGATGIECIHAATTPPEEVA